MRVTARRARASAARGMACVAVFGALVACDRRAPLATCADDLRGVYASELPGEPVPSGDATGAQRWMVLDNGATLEAYPLFADGDMTDPSLEVAPRVLDLSRRDGALAGTLRRRYMRHQARCEATVPVQVAHCAGDTIELVLADPLPPTGFEPCTWPTRGPTRGQARIERWRRE